MTDITHKGVKVLSIGSDRKLFEEGSAVSKRIIEYGTLVDELHTVVFSLKSLGLREKKLSNNVWVYPTNSMSRWSYIRDAARIGKKIVFDNKFIRGRSLITTQDPFESGLAALRVKKKWRLPLQVQVHTDPFSPGFRGALNRLRKIIARKVLRNADSIRVVSDYLKDKISHYSKSPVNVLPIFIDKEQIISAEPSFDLHARFGWHFILLVVARLSPEKHLSTALEALALVRNKYKDTGLVIVGSGSEESKLKSLMKKLNLEDAVSFVGWQDDLTSFYKTANVFVQTSTFEGYGMALIEAGLHGLPVITTSVGIAKELENGTDAYIYEVNHPELFAEGIIDLIEHNHKRESLRTNLKHRIESKLPSKDNYLHELKSGWENTASVIH